MAEQRKKGKEEKGIGHTVRRATKKAGDQTKKVVNKTKDVLDMEEG